MTEYLASNTLGCIYRHLKNNIELYETHSANIHNKMNQLALKMERNTPVNRHIYIDMDLIPDNIKPWVLSLDEKQIAHIFSIVGSVDGLVRGIDTSTDSVGSYKDKVSTICDVVSSSANIGLFGEREVESILHEKYTLISTAKSGKMGDIIVNIGGLRMLVEVKKYSSTVPHAEMDKFYRDIDSNISIAGAMFISLTSPIVGITKVITHTHYTFSGGKIPIIILMLKNIPDVISKECILTGLDMLHCEIDSKSKYINIDDNIVDVVYNIEQNLDYISQCRTIIHETQSMFNKQFGKLIQNTLTAEINIKNSLRVIRSKVGIICIDKDRRDIKTEDALALFNLNTDRYNLIKSIMKYMEGTVTVNETSIVDIKSNVTIKIMKTYTKVAINRVMKNIKEINGEWTYNGRTLTITLTSNTLESIILLLQT